MRTAAAREYLHVSAGRNMFWQTTKRFVDLRPGPRGAGGAMFQPVTVRTTRLMRRRPVAGRIPRPDGSTPSSVAPNRFTPHGFTPHARCSPGTGAARPCPQVQKLAGSLD